MGLLQPHVGHSRGYGPADMIEASSPGGPGEKERIDLSRIRTIDAVDVRGKRVLIRVDFNVPIEKGALARNLAETCCREDAGANAGHDGALRRRLRGP